jgi:hypothetical protein
MGFWLVNRFIDHLQVVTTYKLLQHYRPFAYYKWLHASAFIRLYFVAPQQWLFLCTVFTRRFLVTNLRNADSSASVARWLTSTTAPSTALNLLSQFSWQQLVWNSGTPLTLLNWTFLYNNLAQTQQKALFPTILLLFCLPIRCIGTCSSIVASALITSGICLPGRCIAMESVLAPLIRFQTSCHNIEAQFWHGWISEHRLRNSVKIRHTCRHQRWTLPVVMVEIVSIWWYKLTNLCFYIETKHIFHI